MSSERKAGLILAGFACTEGAWLGLNLYLFTPAHFLHYCGFPSRPAIACWILAPVIIIFFVYFASARLPSVRKHLFRLDGLKLLAAMLALASGFCEEVIFRRMLMDYGAREGWSTAVQVASSAIAFGAVHAIWGLFLGKVSAAAGAMCATSILGLALAVLYVVAGRNVAPCIITHLLINLFVEPGLALAAVRGEMSRVRNLGS
jgi:hypothetical protein